MATNISAQSDGKTPMSDLMFDWISVLHAKAKGIHAYNKYLSDARQVGAANCESLLTKLRDRDVNDLEEIKMHVAMMMNHNDGQAMSRDAGLAKGGAEMRSDGDGANRMGAQTATQSQESPMTHS